MEEGVRKDGKRAGGREMRREGEGGREGEGEGFCKVMSLSTEQLRTVFCITILYAIAHDRVL